MQLNLTASILKTMIKAFAIVINNRCTLPVLGYVLFRYDPDESTVSATVTNLEETLTFHLPPEAAIPGTGIAPVPSGLLRHAAQLPGVGGLPAGGGTNLVRLPTPTEPTLPTRRLGLL